MGPRGERFAALTAQLGQQLGPAVADGPVVQVVVQDRVPEALRSLSETGKGALGMYKKGKRKREGRGRGTPSFLSLTHQIAAKVRLVTEHAKDAKRGRRGTTS